MEHIIKLVTGDWSGDGHCMTSTKIFKSNVSEDELQQAYRKGVNLVGVDVSRLCENYEDNTIPSETARRINDSIPNTFEDDEFEEGGIWTNDDDFTYLWIAIAKAGNPDIVMEEITGSSINIGGYGLFSA